MQDTNKPAIEQSEEFVVPHQPSTSSPHPTFSSVESTHPPKKSRKKLFIILGAILVLLVAGGVTSYLVLQDKHNKDDEKKGPTTSLSAFVDSMHELYPDASGATYFNDTPSSALSLVKKIDTASWVFADADSTALSVRLSRDTPENNKADYDAVTARLAANGLSETVMQNGTAAKYNAKESTVNFFASQYLVCNLHNGSQEAQDSDGNAVDTYALTLNCTESKSFEKTSAVVAPLAKVYFESKNNKDMEDMIFDTPIINVSVVDGYNNAQGRVGVLSDYYGANAQVGMWYQLPNGTWRFFIETKDQNKIHCADYSSEELIEAFLGFTCWDESANASAFVKADDPTVEIIPGALGG